MKLARISGLGVVVGILVGLSGQANAQSPGEGPALGTNRITQQEIESGRLTLREIRAKGRVLFSTPFNLHDGWGDGPVDRSPDG